MPRVSLARIRSRLLQLCGGSSTRLRWWLAGCGLALFIGAAVFADWWLVIPEGRERQFVGRQSCVACHKVEHDRWVGSDHDLAMDLATPDKVLGNFNQQKFTNLGVETLFEREDDKYFVTTEGPTGKQEKFAVKYVFGVRPLQQYMVEFPDGRVQVLSVAWDTIKQQWFDLHPTERIAHDDWLHWTKGGQNWNYMCAECHSTNVHKNFDLAKDTYHTTFSEIDVSCEACHGPGSVHVELASAKSLFWDRKLGYALANVRGPATPTGTLTPGERSGQIESCAKCHSHRRVACGGHQAQKSYYDFYEPQLISTGLYHTDGQILEEVYEHGSFEQSRMFREGVQCSSCHDPHSAKVKFTGNQLCLQCHTLTKGNYDSPAHHHHVQGSVGASCVECHMPVKKYMIVDPRRDHSIRVPRPDLTVKLGVPNACQNCHAKPNETAEWAAAKVVEWYGPKRRDNPHYGETLARGQRGEPAAVDALLGLTQQYGNRDQAKNVGPIVRASAASLLVNYPDYETRRGLTKLLNDPDPIVRLTAARIVGARTPSDPTEGRRLRDDLSPLLDDPTRVVRSEVARMLTAVPQSLFNTRQLAAFQRALLEWREGLQEVIDDAGSHVELAIAHENLGEADLALKQYRQALALRPNETQAVQIRMNLALLEHNNGHDETAEKLYRECFEIGSGTLEKLEIQRKSEPDNPSVPRAIVEQRRRLAGVYYNLGLLLAEKGERQAEAIDNLRKSITFDPENARVHYNLGLMLHLNRDFPAAQPVLEQACRLDPTMIDSRLALTELYRSVGKWPEAVESATRLMQLSPQYVRLQTLIRREAEAAAFGPAPPVSGSK